MTRDEFMEKARHELDLIMTSRKNAIMNIIEQAWAEGKRNAELDEITDILKKALDRAQPSYPVMPSYPDPVSPWINPIITCDTTYWSFARRKRRRLRTMRPIDADALKITLDTFATMVGFGGVYDRGQVMECIDAAPTVGGWISADKRPPKQGRYLVWGLTQFIPDHNDEPNGYWQTKIANWSDRIGWDCKVKFWQMLPEPPKEVSGDA